jgi:DNA phosphorothioation-associated putative methyltransferase
MPGSPALAQNIVQLCQRSPVGKLLPDALYIHAAALSNLDPALQALEQLTRRVSSQVQHATIVKFSLNAPKIIYLFYPDFDIEAHPALQSSIQVNFKTLEAKERDYSTTQNPPVLHRKEAFVATDYPRYETFAWLTKQEEVLGLLENCNYSTQ